MAQAKKTKAEQIASMPIEQIAKLKGTQGLKTLQSYVRTLRSGYKRRVGSFARQNQISHAQISLENSYAAPAAPVSKLSRNQLIMEFARYAKFFNDKTSTIQGIKEVNREQDVRIFGATPSGRPKKTMTNDERRRYWELYDEFLNQKPSAYRLYSSETVQQTIANAVFSKDGTMPVNLVEFFNNIEAQLSQEADDIGVGFNVYSGRGDIFTG